MGVERDEIKLRVCSQKKQKLKQIALTNKISLNRLILESIDRGLEKEEVFPKEVQRSLQSDLQQLISVSLALKIEISPELISDLIDLVNNVIARLNSLSCLK